MVHDRYRALGQQSSSSREQQHSNFCALVRLHSPYRLGVDARRLRNIRCHYARESIVPLSHPLSEASISYRGSIELLPNMLLTSRLTWTLNLVFDLSCFLYLLLIREYSLVVSSFSTAVQLMLYWIHRLHQRCHFQLYELVLQAIFCSCHADSTIKNRPRPFKVAASSSMKNVSRHDCQICKIFALPVHFAELLQALRELNPSKEQNAGDRRNPLASEFGPSSFRFWMLSHDRLMTR